MHLSIIYAYTYVTGIGASKRAIVHFFHHTFQNRWKKSCINSTSYDAIIENKFTTPIQLVCITAPYIKVFWFGQSLVPWLYSHIHFTKLSRAATLFFMTITGIRHFANCFAVSYSWLYKLHFHFVTVFYLPFCNGQMHITLAVD